MLKKRLIGVITIKNGLAVQSFGFSRFLPLGKPQIIAENLDRWGVDEIIIQSIDRSLNNSGPDLNLIKKIASIPLSTPIAYAGGIKKKEDALNVIEAGAERIVVDSQLHSSSNSLKKISEYIGAQALIICLPCILENSKLKIFNYLKKESVEFSDRIMDIISSNIVSEILVIDKSNEGNKGAFNSKIFEMFPKIKNDLILFGGLSDSEFSKKLISKENVSALAIGNSLNYSEHSVQNFKKNLNCSLIREPQFLNAFGDL